MSIGTVGGILTSELKGIELNISQAENFRISYDDWKKVDVNNDGKITANEFLALGLRIQSIFNAFKTLSKENRLCGRSCVKQPNIKKEMKTAPHNLNPYNLNHPNVQNPLLANECDILA